MVNRLRQILRQRSFEHIGKKESKKTKKSTDGNEVQAHYRNNDWSRLDNKGLFRRRALEQYMEAINILGT